MAVQSEKFEGEEILFFWEYDSLSKLVRDCQWGLQGCSSYFYVDNQLKSTITIGGDDEQTNIDTVVQIYDSRHFLCKKIRSAYATRGERGHLIFEGLTIYDYEQLENNTVIRKTVRHDTYDMINRRIRQDPDTLYDTLIYNHRKQLISETDIKYGKRTYYRYNNRGQIVEKKWTTEQGVFKSSFIYRSSRLIQEELCGKFDKGKCITSLIWYYEYNSDGLLQRIRWNQFSLNYNYEYYH